jgi:threonine/homoserine/homoserine lactone efflux protein
MSISSAKPKMALRFLFPQASLLVQSILSSAANGTQMPNLLFPLFFTGIILGFSIAAPVGPIGVLCIRRTLAEGRRFGLISGLGAAAADAVYGAVAGFGLTLIPSVLIDQQEWLRLIGGLFLCYLGVRTFFSKASEQAADVKRGSLWTAFGSTFFLTLTNPMTILSFAAIFAGFDVAGENNNFAAAASLIAGIFTGSAIWWLSLSAGVGFLRRKISTGILVWINRLSGVVITIFGLLAFFLRS